MKVIVRIECDNISELNAHLSELKRQIKKEAKRLHLHPINDCFLNVSNKNLFDDNCYGTHSVEIKN